MSINPVLLQYQQDKFPQMYNDYKMIKNAVAFNKEDDSVFEDTLPIYGQVNEVEEHIKNKDFDTAGAITSLAVLKGPEEVDDLFSAANQIKHKLNKKEYVHPFDYTKAELESSFFRDSILAKHMNYRSKDCIFPEFSRWLLKKDISLLDTKFGNFIRKILGINFTQVETPIEDIVSTQERRRFLEAIDFSSNSLPKEIIGRALARTSKLGTLALATIEGIDTKNDIQDGANPFKEIAKGATSLGVTIGGIGILGAIGSKYYGPVGSVVGAAAGTVLGAVVSNKLD